METVVVVVVLIFVLGIRRLRFSSTFRGKNIGECNDQLREFVDKMEENDWRLVSSEVKKIHRE